MRVAILTSDLTDRAGGVITVICDHVSELAQLGVELSVHGCQDANGTANKDAWAHAEIFARPSKLQSFSYAPGILDDIMRFKPDVLHLHGLWQYPSIVARNWRRKTNGALVISPHGMLDPWALRNGAIKKTLFRHLVEDENLRSAAAIHCVSESELVSVRDLGFSNPAALIPNGVMLPDYPTTEEHTSLDGGKGKKTLLFLGRIDRKKGIDIVIKAWAYARSKHLTLSDEWRFVIAGWGDDKYVAECKELAASLGVSGDIHFPGPVFGQDKDKLLRSASGFILASHSEGLPVAILEAWSYALPVFMTEECNVPEGFSAVAAVRIDRDPERIGALLVQWLYDPSMAAIGERGRRLVEQRFTKKVVALELLDLYRWLSGASGVPSSLHTDLRPDVGT